MRALLVWAVLAAPVAAHAQDDAMSGRICPRERAQVYRHARAGIGARGTRGKTDREIKPNGRLSTVPESGGYDPAHCRAHIVEAIAVSRGDQYVHLVRGAMVALDKYGLSLLAPVPSTSLRAWRRRVPGSDRRANDRFVLHLALGSQDDHSSFGFPGLVLGNNGFALALGFDFGITERLRWIAPLPLFAYRIGDRGRGKFELMPWGGVTNVGIGWNGIDGTVFSYGLGVGFDAPFVGRQKSSMGFRCARANLRRHSLHAAPPMKNPTRSAPCSRARTSSSRIG